MRRALPALCLAIPALLAGCSSAPTADSSKIQIVTAFYPLEFSAESVGGDAVKVTNLTAPGAEPHDLELSPTQVAAIADADLVLYVKGFQPAVDDAVAQQAADHSLDVSEGLHRLSGVPGEAPAAAGTNLDPHIWLDPANISAIAKGISSRLSEIDPTDAPKFAANSNALAGDMTKLTADFTQGLAKCRSRTLVTSHDAFAYLASAFDLTQVGISGLSPDAEPSPARLADIAALVSDQGITTIYYEALVSPKVAETIAAETGAKATMLDPLEGLAAGSNDTYSDVMRRNLSTLIAGQGCT